MNLKQELLLLGKEGRSLFRDAMLWIAIFNKEEEQQTLVLLSDSRRKGGTKRVTTSAMMRSVFRFGREKSSVRQIDPLS